MRSVASLLSYTAGEETKKVTEQNQFEINSELTVYINDVTL